MYKCVYILCDFGLRFMLFYFKMLISKYISIKKIMSQMFGVIFLSNSIITDLNYNLIIWLITTSTQK